MSKIICDVCGTKYPDTAEACPICGYSRAVQEPEAAQTVLMDEVVIEARPRVKGGRFSAANVRKRNREYPLYEEPAEEQESEGEYYQEEYDYDDAPEREKAGPLLNVLLVIVILALLAVSAFICVRFFLPTISKMEEQPATTESVQTEEPVTEAPTVPCTELQLTETAVELTSDGQMYLLNIVVLPEDTTDAMVYSSSDENVATVNEEGRITAVGEGTAVITITCGNVSQQFSVSVVAPTEAPTEEPTEPPTEPGVQKTVTNAFVNIRSGAGTEYEKVGEYKKGDVVTIYEETVVGGRPWGRTDDGWICTEYVK